VIEALFWLLAKRQGGCMLWQRTQVTIHQGARVLRDAPHRVAFLLKHGEIPQGHLVRHTCANHHCVNPEHLVLGNAADNVRDMHNHGTAHNSKLSTEHVFQIRERRQLGASFRDLAEEYGVTVDTIRNIVRLRTRREG
jgi:DNA-binding transcriptional regulator YiaG